MTPAQQYLDILDNQFSGLSLRKGLFYCWDKGLRFDLQIGKTNTPEYFKTVQERSIKLFEAVFSPNAAIFLILKDSKWRKQRIRSWNFVFRQIQNLTSDQIHYRNDYGTYEPGDQWMEAVINTSVDKLNYQQILTAIGHSDFPGWKPRLDQYRFATTKEIYFIDINSSMIFNMYDDRGLDIIAPDIQALKPIYSAYKDWLLDYDRELMDERMKI